MIDLSVHLITYNNEKHIEETLKSILKQKVDFKYEIVVGDDCSSDGTLDIVNKYAFANPEIFKVSKNERQLGILENFKVTLDRCSGSYVFDIAGDDLLKGEDALQKMVDVLRNDTSLGFVDSGFDKFYEKEKTTKLFTNKKILSAPKDHYKNQLLLGRFTPIGICYNKEHLYKFVDFDSYLNMKLTIDDYPILVDLAMNTNFATINESLHIYKVHSRSFSHMKNFEKQFFQKNQMKDLFYHFSNKYHFSKEIIEDYFNIYYKELLFLAGYFEKGELGKKMYQKIKTKSIKDSIHYYASQNPLFRKLISAF